LISIFKELIVTYFMLYIRINENAAGDANAQAQEIDSAVNFVSSKVA
jgi:hypothetical protein